MEEGNNLFGESRDEIYAKANPKLAPETEETTEVSAETTTEIKTEELKPEPPVKEEAELNKDDKTVPYGALKEERERRKSIQKDLDESNKRLQQVLSDFQNYVQNNTKPTEQNQEVIEDYDKEILESRRIIKTLESKIAALEGNFSQEQQRKAQSDLQTKLSGVSSALDGEGYPGFLQFIGNVQAELNKIANDDMEEAKSLDNPDGWKKIYKERVFPSLASIFTKKEEKERKDKKEEAKRDLQSAVLTPGSAPAGEKPEGSWDYDDYLKMRSTAFAGGHSKK